MPYSLFTVGLLFRLYVNSSGLKYWDHPLFFVGFKLDGAGTESIKVPRGGKFPLSMFSLRESKTIAEARIFLHVRYLKILDSGTLRVFLCIQARVCTGKTFCFHSSLESPEHMCT